MQASVYPDFVILAHFFPSFCVSCALHAPLPLNMLDSQTAEYRAPSRSTPVTESRLRSFCFLFLLPCFSSNRLNHQWSWLLSTLNNFCIYTPSAHVLREVHSCPPHAPPPVIPIGVLRRFSASFFWPPAPELLFQLPCGGEIAPLMICFRCYFFSSLDFILNHARGSLSEKSGPGISASAFCWYEPFYAPPGRWYSQIPFLFSQWSFSISWRSLIPSPQNRFWLRGCPTPFRPMALKLFSLDVHQFLDEFRIAFFSPQRSISSRFYFQSKIFFRAVANSL